MSKPWIGYIAVGFLFVAGLFEFAGGNTNVGILFIVLSFISLALRIYFNKKLKESNKDYKE
jgi:hypothetical protein